MGVRSGDGMSGETFIIEDWTGRRLFPDRTFETFEDGWAHVYANVEDEGGNTFDDYYVEKIDGSRSTGGAANGAEGGR